ncbi:MAG: hypothetical protein ACJ71D_00270 [Nitrososphaera sp.]
MPKKYREPPQPSHYRLALSCNHAHIISHEEIRNSIESNYTPFGSDITIVCPLRSINAPGSCDIYIIIHKVAAITPMYLRQVNEAEAEQH